VDIVGSLTADASKLLGLKKGVPVIAGGGDGACANVGVGISVSEGGAYINLGTTAWISANSLVPVIDEKARIFDIMSLDGETFGVFGTMQTAGKCVAWLSELMSLDGIDEFRLLAACAPPGADGLLFLPYLEGERAPIFDSNARGVFFGISSKHSRSHFCRAVLEGVGLALRDILSVFRETRVIGDMRVIGGGAENELWISIISDICGLNLQIGKDSDSITSLGAALAAAVGAGLYKTLDEAVQNIATKGRVSPENANRSVYDAMMAKYLRLYPSVKDLY
jgi:xylulokinase